MNESTQYDTDREDRRAESDLQERERLDEAFDRDIRYEPRGEKEDKMIGLEFFGSALDLSNILGLLRQGKLDAGIAEHRFSIHQGFGRTINALNRAQRAFFWVCIESRIKAETEDEEKRS